MPGTLAYGLDFSEDAALPGGTPVRVRAVRPTDKRRLVEGLARLSPASRRARFFAPKNAFTARELRFLTEVDGSSHYALGAVLLEPDGSEGEGLGIARFVRDAADPEVAEPAIVVVDAWQRRGVGRLLFSRLVEAARERGVRRFRGEFLAANAGIRRLLESLHPQMRTRAEGSLVQVEAPLGEPAAPAAPPEPFPTILRLAAEGAIVLQG